MQDKMALKILLLLSSLVSLIECSQVSLDEPFRKYQSNYYQINEYLEKNTGNTNNVDEIMAKANDWLNSIRLSGRDRDLVKALELFTSMLELTSESSCNHHGYQVLVHNYQALSNLVRYGIRKIDKVAKELVRRHLKLCAPLYPKIYSIKINRMNPETVKRVETFGKSIIGYNVKRGHYGALMKFSSVEEALQSSPMSFIYLMGRDGHRDERDDACQMADQLEYHMDDPRRQFESLLPKLFQEYIVEPCEQFSEQIGRDIYLPAEWDSRARLDEHLMDDGQQRDDGPMEYRLAMAYCRACELYVVGAHVNKTQLIETMLTC